MRQKREAFMALLKKKIAEAYTPAEEPRSLVDKNSKKILEKKKKD